MENILKYTFPEILQQTVGNFPDKPALAYVGEDPITYLEYRNKVNSLITILQDLGIKKGDKIAILSQNMPEWVIAYIGITCMGAVAVPLLTEFSETEISNILEHSESIAIFISDRFKHKLQVKGLKVINIELSEISDELKKPDNKPAENLYLSFGICPDDLASIIYTSGTTGKQKGVMLSHRNISFNAHKSRLIQPVMEDDVFLSILPLSHTYENTLGLVLPLIGGASVYYLKQHIVPSLLMDALKKVRPTTMLTVPLIIENIFKRNILPVIMKKPLLRRLYSFGLIRKWIHYKAGKKLMKSFGGRIIFFGIGGSKLDPLVERFLIEAKFPFAIGYGMTEAAPLLAGAAPGRGKPESTGPQIQDIELKIHGAGRPGEEGEIWARGNSIMLGYYKDPELTSETITPDGWLKTGDLATYDKHGYIYIKGRLKNTILGANGENIYPEEIEYVINKFKHVNESLVLEKKGKLVALVNFNQEEVEKACRQLYGEMSEKIEKRIEELKEELRHYVNSRVNKFSQLQIIIVQTEPFQKTATQKIKRYLYY